MRAVVAVAVLGVVLTATACGRPASQLDDAALARVDGVLHQVDVACANSCTPGEAARGVGPRLVDPDHVVQLAAATPTGRVASASVDVAVTVTADVGWGGGDTEQQRCVHVTFAPSSDPDHPGPQADRDLVAC